MTSKISRPIVVAPVFAIALCLAAGSAQAECDSVQEKQVGQAIAEATERDLPANVKSAGTLSQRPVIDILKCEGGSRHFEAQFRYSVPQADGKSVWISGSARGTDAEVRDIRYYKASPQLSLMLGSL